MTKWDPDKSLPPGDTRAMIERERVKPHGRLSGKRFWMALVVIAGALAAFALLLR